jgi:DNA-3-methyladenine glycosylase I
LIFVPWRAEAKASRLPSANPCISGEKGSVAPSAGDPAVSRRNHSVSFGPAYTRFVKPRCAWAGKDPVMIAYHDDEWGVPLHDDRALFEFLILEGAQAGLSWSTILNKRAAYRAAFDGFDPRVVAQYGEEKIAALMADSGIVRNRLKIGAAIRNARAFLAVQKEFNSFDRYVWGFVGGRPVQPNRMRTEEVPARTAESDAMSKDLQKRGFTFVGSTICYAFMQATGMVNDHVVECFRHGEVG